MHISSNIYYNARKYIDNFFQLENFLQTPQAELNEVDWVASDGRQMFLRQTLRGLFLDACVVDSERAAWMGVMCQQMNASQLAKFLILLYGPVRQGNSRIKIPLANLEYNSHIVKVSSIGGSLRIFDRLSFMLKSTKHWPRYFQFYGLFPTGPPHHRFTYSFTCQVSSSLSK